ncbi:MAG TPA: ATP-grasp domain-containing protein [Acidimicrobiia bacterium]|nr:ATP-grasp domain-containing protein [Acidimicrobiia bacterium]
MNALICSAGRRTTLVRAFRRVLEPRRGFVVAGDVDPLAPALLTADYSEMMPRLSSPEYSSRLLELCQERQIALVVPTIDTELPLLAGLSEEFAASGITVLVSAMELIDITSDKRKTAEVFNARGIRTPRSWAPGDLAEDVPELLFVKPNRGSASMDTYLVPGDRVEAILPMVNDPVVQEYIEAPEITVDALLDLTGDVIHMVPRIRLKTVGGESVQGVTMPDEPIRPWLLDVLRVISSLGGRGPVTIQAFLTPDSPTLIEVNPRFGGGFPLTLEAGGEYPKWIVEMIEGGSVPPRLGEYRRGLFMTRTLEETYVDGGWAQ